MRTPRRGVVLVAHRDLEVLGRLEVELVDRGFRVVTAHDGGDAFADLACALTSERLSSVGQLAGGVAHEIDTPLSYVLGNHGYAVEVMTELATIADTLPPEAASSAPVVVGEVVDVSEAARSAVRIAGAKLREWTTVVLDLEDGALVHGSSGSLCQVSVNLLVNAAEAAEDAHAATSAPVEVHVSTRRDGSVIRATVRDTGPGISGEHLARLFDPFFSTRVARAGLGLPRGATFTLVFPVSLDPAPALDPPPDPPKTL